MQHGGLIDTGGWCRVYNPSCVLGNVQAVERDDNIEGEVSSRLSETISTFFLGHIIIIAVSWEVVTCCLRAAGASYDG